MRTRDTDAIAHPWAKRQARHSEKAGVTTGYMLGTSSGQLKGFCPSPPRRQFADDGLHGRGLNTTINFLVQSRALRGAMLPGPVSLHAIADQLFPDHSVGPGCQGRLDGFPKGIGVVERQEPRKMKRSNHEIHEREQRPDTGEKSSILSPDCR